MGDLFIEGGLFYESGEAKTKFTDMGEPNGIIDRAESTISFVDGTRTFSIQPVGINFGYYFNSIKHQSLGATKVIDDTEGLHVLFFDGSSLEVIANPTNAQVSYILIHKVIVAYVYWDVTNKKGKLLEERHGIVMDGVTHENLHFSFGVQFKDGLALGDILADQDGSSNTHAQFSVASGAIKDEDLELSINAVVSTVGLEIWYLDSSNWRWTTNSGFSVLTTGTGRLAYNNSGTQSEVNNNSFVLCHVLAWNAVDKKPIAIQGQNQYGNVTAARIGAEEEISNLILAGLPSPELKAIGSIIFQTADGYTNAVKGRIRTTDTGEDYVDFRRSALSSSVTASDHGLLAGLVDDDHSQYLLLAGRSGQTIDDTITVNEGMIINADEGDNDFRILLKDGGGSGAVFYDAGTGRFVIDSTIQLWAANIRTSNITELALFGGINIEGLHYENDYINKSGSDSAGLTFDGSDGATLTQSLIVNGNIGVGGVTPTADLHVASAENASILLEATSGSSVKTGYIQFKGGTENFTIDCDFTDTVEKLRILCGGADPYLTVRTTGNVGINQDNPGTKLDVGGSLRSQGFRVDSNIVPTSGEGMEVQYTSSQGYLVAYDRTGTTFQPLNLCASQIEFNIDSFNTNSMMLDNNGYLGIGISSPLSNLHVKRTSAGDAVTIENSAATCNINLNTPVNEPVMFNFQEAGVDKFYMYYAFNGDYFGFDSNLQSDILVITEAGNVGIGITTPNTKFHNAGGHTRNVTTVAAASYNLLITDDILDVIYTATGAVAIDLKTAQVVRGRTIVVKDGGFNATTNNITITTEGSEKIDNQDTAVINVDDAAITIFCDGTNWKII